MPRPLYIPRQRTVYVYIYIYVQSTMYNYLILKANVINTRGIVPLLMPLLADAPFNAPIGRCPYGINAPIYWQAPIR